MSQIKENKNYRVKDEIRHSKNSCSDAKNRDIYRVPTEEDHNNSYVIKDGELHNDLSAFLENKLHLPMGTEVTVIFSGKDRSQRNVIRYHLKEDEEKTIYTSFYRDFKQFFEIPKCAMVKKDAEKKKQTKIDRMADKGIYVEITTDDKGNKYFNDNSLGASIIYINGEGKSVYTRCNPNREDTQWHTLQWNCAPTRKKVAQGYSSRDKNMVEFMHNKSNGLIDKNSKYIYRTWDYYATWQDYVNNCNFNVPKISKQINPETVI